MEGTYDGEIVITSNDPLEPITTIDTRMIVLQQPPAVTPYDIFETTRIGEEGLIVPDCMTYTLTNNGAEAVNWSASKTTNWLDLTPSSGNLAPDEAVSLNVCINSNAYALSVGTYRDTVTFINMSTGDEHERLVILKALADDYLTEYLSPSGIDIENQTLRFYPDGSINHYAVEASCVKNRDRYDFLLLR